MASILLSIPIQKQSKKNILEQIIKYMERQNRNLKKKENYFHITSLNPENFVIMAHDENFKKIVRESQVQLIDGVGVQLAGTILGYSVGERVTGADLMIDLLKVLENGRFKGLLIGGKKNLAKNIVDCYLKKFPKMKLIGIEGINDIRNPKKPEIDDIFSIVSQYRPHLIFAAFGSPYQEVWFDTYKDKLKGIVCMGVGGGFDFLGRRVQRAPAIVRRIGLEWLFRLLAEPWRWRRQLRLFKFMQLVLKEKFT